MNLPLIFESSAIIFSTLAATSHLIHGIRLHDKNNPRNGKNDRGDHSKIMILCSIIFMGLSAISLAVYPSHQPHLHYIKAAHLLAFMLPITIMEFFILDE